MTGAATAASPQSKAGCARDNDSNTAFLARVWGSDGGRGSGPGPGRKNSFWPVQPSLVKLI